MQIYINPFACIYGSNDFTMSIYDNTSITETIYNVYDMVPFDYNTSSLYGHYGLFFLLPLRILGRATPEKVVGLLACAGGIAQLATVYIINHFSPKRWIAGLLCLAAVIRMSYGYLAISPIRTMWPLIIGAYVVYMVKHEFRLRYEFMGIVLCSLAVVWNTETGIACSFGFAVYTFFMNYRKIDCDAKLSKKYFFFMQNILMLLVKMIFSLLIAVLIVNVYNVICGAGYLMFRGFFYPYQDSNFIYELLRCNPPSGNHAWVYIMALLLAMIAWGVKEEWFCSKTERNEKKDDAICAMSLACIGLVAFVYYMNEAHWGCMEIVHQICFGLIAIILGRIYKYIHNAEGKLSDLILRGIALLSLMIALFLAVNVYNDPVRFAARNYAGAYSFETFHQDTTQLQNEIPENTFGVGQGVSIIYHSIGWNNNLKFQDTTALTIDHTGTVFDAAINEILKNDTFLITDFFYDQEVLNAVLQRDPSYKKVKTVTVNGWDFCLYSR